MELNINLLKVLGEEELQRLNAKVRSYTTNPQNIILGKSISDIQKKILDTNFVIDQLEKEELTNKKLLEQLLEEVNIKEKRYNYLMDSISVTESTIKQLEKISSDKGPKIPEMDNTLKKLKLHEQTLTNDLSDIQAVLMAHTQNHLKNKKIIQDQIKKLELDLSGIVQASFEQHRELCTLASDIYRRHHKNIRELHDWGRESESAAAPPSVPQPPQRREESQCPWDGTQQPQAQAQPQPIRSPWVMPVFTNALPPQQPQGRRVMTLYSTPTPEAPAQQQPPPPPPSDPHLKFIDSSF
jgi:hypothetical protein